MPATHSREVTVPAGSVALSGDLTLPEGARGVVLFAHGSGSSRHSPRNRLVARILNEAGVGTLLIDLLSGEEERRDLATRELRFDIGLLAERVEAALDWLGGDAQTAGLDFGCFGASTGAAAAIEGAARRPDRVRAVVSRGGRPDLADPGSLSALEAPTLLIVGERDQPVIELNRGAMELIRADVQLEIVPGATHLFEEPGALERVAELARDWFLARFADATGGGARA